MQVKRLILQLSQAECCSRAVADSALPLDLCREGRRSSQLKIRFDERLSDGHKTLGSRPAAATRSKMLAIRYDQMRRIKSDTDVRSLLLVVMLNEYIIAVQRPISSTLTAAACY